MNTDIHAIITLGDGSSPKKSLTKSEIAFPYVGLEDAVHIAQAIFENGASLSRDQIAGVMNTAGSGSFPLRIAAARMFGLIESLDGKYVLTELGTSIMSTDEYESKFARKEAFLKVPLYQKTYDTFRNRNLPSRPHGLEQSFVTFGVSAKQKDKARQAFERSANFAGFFDVNKDRLVEPIIAPPSNLVSRNVLAPTIEELSEQADQRPFFSAGAVEAIQEPLIHGILKRLPPIGADWPIKDRIKWLKTLIGNFNAVYIDSVNPDDEIQIENRSAG